MAVRRRAFALLCGDGGGALPNPVMGFLLFIEASVGLGRGGGNSVGSGNPANRAFNTC